MQVSGMNRADLLKPITDIYAANGKVKLLVCLGCLCFRVKIFVFEVNIRSPFAIFV